MQSKHRWWNNQQFDKYYNPLKQMDVIPESEMEYRQLDSKKIAQMFKREAVGRSISYRQFKDLIASLADNMYFDLENPEYSHPEAYEKFLQQILHIDDYQRIKASMQPLHQKQQLDFDVLIKQPSPVKPLMVASGNHKRVSANYEHIMASKSTPQISMAQLIQSNYEVTPNVFALKTDSNP